MRWSWRFGVNVAFVAEIPPQTSSPHHLTLIVNNHVTGVAHAEVADGGGEILGRKCGEGKW